MGRVLTVFLLLASSILYAQQPTDTNADPTPASPLHLVEPLFIEDGEFSSTLWLTNNALDQVSVQVELLDSNGAQITSKELTLQGHSNLPLRIRQLLVQAGSAAATGSVMVTPPPMDGPPIVAQLSIVSKTGGTRGYIEEEILPQNDGA